MSNLNSLHNRVVWFDVAVDDLDRACAFYASVLNLGVHRQSFGEYEFAVLDHADGNGGCLVPRKPGTSTGAAVLIYLNVNGRIRDAVSKVVPNGGEVVSDVHSIGPHGFRALLRDSEGNDIALHSETDA